MIIPYVHMRQCYLCRLAFHRVSDNICSDNGLWPISAPGHCLNQCWFIVNWTPGKNPFKNVVCQNGGHFRSRADELRPIDACWWPGDCIRQTTGGHEHIVPNSPASEKSSYCQWAPRILVPNISNSGKTCNL